MIVITKQIAKDIDLIPFLDVVEGDTMSEEQYIRLFAAAAKDRRKGLTPFQEEMKQQIADFLGFPNSRLGGKRSQGLPFCDESLTECYICNPEIQVKNVMCRRCHYALSA